MKTTHTPGPWIVRGGNVIESLSRINVAKAWMTDGEEECANARLIAAAPDLLAAALRSAGFMEKRGVGAGEHDLRVAIAKATGMTFEEVTKASLAAIDKTK